MELLDTFKATKKAADAATTMVGDSSPEVKRCLDALRHMRKIAVSTEDLLVTKVGRGLRDVAKHPNGKIKAAASDLLEFWKSIVREEALKVEQDSTTLGLNHVEKKKSGKALKSPSIKNDSKTEERAIKVKEEKQFLPATTKPSSSSAEEPPPNLLAPVPKLNDDKAREKIRNLLIQALSRVPSEIRSDKREELKILQDEVDLHDPMSVADAVENALFAQLGRYLDSKHKYWSIMCNLKDNKNPDLRRRVLLGHVEPESLTVMTPAEMASDERKRQDRQIQERALFECESTTDSKATTDQFRCGKCGQRKCTYYQMQTRSADEPMTTFVTCVNCNNHWKFC